MKTNAAVQNKTQSQEKKMNNLTTKMIAAVAVSGMLIAGTESHGGVITSDAFSFGYGFTVGGAWNTNETAGVNTSTVQGDFSLSPNVTGSTFSGGGTFFPNRILTGNGPNGYVGWSNGWGLSVVGAYTGTPVPDYGVTLVITRISIYGSPWTSTGTDAVWFNETTAGHTAESAHMPTLPYQGDQNPASYAQLGWDPADFQVSGTSTTRTFAIGATDGMGLDGLEIFGYLQYGPVPEPAALVLLSLGLGGLLLRRK